MVSSHEVEVRDAPWSGSGPPAGGGSTRPRRALDPRSVELGRILNQIKTGEAPTVIRNPQLPRSLVRRVRLRRKRNIRRGPQHKRHDLPLPQQYLRPHAPTLMPLAPKVEILELHVGIPDVVERVLSHIAQVEPEPRVGRVKDRLEVRGDGRRGGLGRGRRDGRVGLEGGRVRGARVVERRGALDADGHRAADDFDAADEPWEERAGGRAARLAGEEVCDFAM